ncbi:hypothetical protein EIP86_005706 [Pleurotus ostreatoroseus]|nr:hypothetical protein EIP86_005706 [Pleurotus ostreatoroseus]
MHISTGPGAGKRPAANCGADTCRQTLLSPRSPSPPPIVVSYPAVRSRAPPDGAMLPPDILLARAKERVPSDDSSPQPDPESPPRGRQSQRLERPPDDELVLHHEGSGELPSYVPKSVRRFGILFTMRKPYQRHHR